MNTEKPKLWVINMQVWNKESSLGGWSRIMATLAQMGTALAIGMNQPDVAPDLGDITAQGSQIIASGYAFYAQLVLFTSACVTAWSKFISAFKG